MKKLRIAHGIERKDMARVLNVKYSTLSNWENGLREPELESLLKISEVLEISTDYLLTDHSNPKLAGHSNSNEDQANHLINMMYQHYLEIPLEHRNDFEKDLLEYMSFLIFKYKKFNK